MSQETVACESVDGTSGQQKAEPRDGVRTRGRDASHPRECRRQQYAGLARNKPLRRDSCVATEPPREATHRNVIDHIVAASRPYWTPFLPDYASLTLTGSFSIRRYGRLRAELTYQPTSNGKIRLH